MDQVSSGMTLWIPLTPLVPCTDRRPPSLPLLAVGVHCERREDECALLSPSLPPSSIGPAIGGFSMPQSSSGSKPAEGSGTCFNCRLANLKGRPFGCLYTSVGVIPPCVWVACTHMHIPAFASYFEVCCK